MKITEIEKKSKTRYTVYVDGEYFYILDAEILTEHHVRVGMEVTEAFLEQLKAAAQLRRARERAFYLLSYRDHSEKELYQKLRRNVSDEAAAHTVAKMLELGLLNDERYAEKLADYYLNQKQWSEKKSLYEMRQKGIPDEVARLALEACEVQPEDQIRRLIDTKYARYLGDPKGNQKVINALLRLGFSYGDVRAAVREYLEQIELEEEDEWQYE